MKQKAIFFLGPRLIDFDTLLPFALVLKDIFPKLEIMFISFSKSHYEYLEKNVTLIEGVNRCGKLYCFPIQNDQSKVLTLLKVLLSNITLSYWILISKKPLLFSSKAYKSGVFARCYLLSKIKSGRSFLVTPTRLIESCMLPEQIKEFEKKIPGATPTWINKIFGRNTDGIIYFHDEQELFTKICITEPLDEQHRYLCAGLLTTHKLWRNLIDDESNKALELFSANSKSKDMKIYTVYTGKSMQSRWLKTNDSIKTSFESVVDALIKIEPNAIILVRPHPAGMDEEFIKKIFKKYASVDIRIDLSHPDVQATISNRIIFTAPTNIMSTNYCGNRIDCIDYSDESLSEFNFDSPYSSYGVMYADPSSKEFFRVFERLIKDRTLYDDELMNNVFFKRNQPESEKIKKYLECI